ncbi:tyrosine-type recombinase/integrase [Streptomyces sp. cg35]|uniref:tyrosine-type recombinase/integrase n=1 Tax=Streptomyces sp. cg35 TaxID=3421650 RepID=UPI003D16F7F1
MPITTDLVVPSAGELRLDENEAYIQRVCAEIERQWLLEIKNPNTRRAYTRCIGYWFDWGVDNDVSPLAARREHSAQWSADLQEALAPGSVNQALSAMNSWYEYGLDEYPQAFQIQRTPWRKKHRIEVSDESQTLGLDKDQARAFRAMSWEYGTVDAAVCETLLNLGLRSAELENANIRHYGEARGHRTLKITRKRSKTQTLVVPPQAAKAIDAHLATRPNRQPDDALILCADGKRLTNRRIATIVTRSCRAARVTLISPHGLRHTCATLMLDADVPLRKVQRWLGHADPRTTNRYDMSITDIDEAPVLQLADFLATA